MEEILKHKNTYITAALFFYLLYGVMALTSFGFDDEFYNFDIIEKLNFREFIDFNLTRDFHPPLSYLLNLILFKLSGNWHLVRLVSSLLLVSSMIWAGIRLRRSGREIEGLILLVLLGTSPSLLLWGASVRWYAYFIAVLIWLCMPPEREGAIYWHKLFAGSYLLGNFGYIAFLAFLPLLFIYWQQNKSTSAEKLNQILKIGPIYLLCYLPQLYLLIAIQIHNGEPQTYNLFRSAVGYYLGQISNQGVFPLSPAGLAGLAGYTICAFFILLKPGKKILENRYLIPYVVLTLSLVLIGFSGKFRNVVILEPLFVLVLCSSPYLARINKAYLLGLGLIVVSSLVGQWNVLTQEETIKSSWNIATRKTLNTIESIIPNCSDFGIVLHDPALTRALEAKGYLVFGPQATRSYPSFPDDPSCVVLINTHPGSMTEEGYASFNEDISTLSYEESRDLLTIPDKYYAYKQILDERVPQNALQIVLLTDVSGFDTIKD